jgi:hypothetical protein
LLSFAYVYFLESGLFNGLRPIQIKIFLAFQTNPMTSVIPFLSSPACRIGADELATRECVARIQFLWKKLFNFLIQAMRTRSNRAASPLASAFRSMVHSSRNAGPCSCPRSEQRRPIADWNRRRRARRRDLSSPQSREQFRNRRPALSHCRP